MNIISSARRVDVLLVVILGILWGSTFVAIKISLEVLHPFHLVFIRIFLGGLFVCVYLYYKGMPIFCSGAGWRTGLIIGFFNIILPSILIHWAQTHINSSLTAMIFSLTPLTSIIANHLFTDDDLINVYKIIGLALGFTGFMIFIGNPDFLSEGFGIYKLIAILCVFFANICQIISGILLRYIKMPSPISVLGNIFIFSTILSFPFLFIFDFELSSLSDIGLRHFLSISYLGFCTTGIAYTMRFILILRIGQSYTSMGAYLIPPLGALLGWLLLDEILSFYTLISLSMIIVGMYVARKGQLLNALRARKLNNIITD